MTTLNIDLGSHVGLIGDVHGNLPFLIEAIFQLEEQGATTFVQLGDFGLLWGDTEREHAGISTLNDVLRAMDREMFVVLGNHENYDLVDAIRPDPDGARRLDRVTLLPRSGRVTFAGRPAGFLAGAGSIDRYYRMPWRSWWPQELPTPEEAQGLIDTADAISTATISTAATNKVDVLFAHDALRGPGLEGQLSTTRNRWNEADLAYAEHAGNLFSERVLAVLSDGGLVVSGHYHFRHSADEVLGRPDGTPVRARSEILSSEWDEGAVGILDAGTLAVRTWAIDPGNANDMYNSLRNRPDWPAIA